MFDIFRNCRLQRNSPALPKGFPQMRPSLPLLSLLLAGSLAVPAATATAAPALTGLDVSSGNRREPVSGLYDWSKAGYRGTGVLPGDNEVNTSANCQITAAELASQFNVRPNDTADDTAGLQAAIGKSTTGLATAS